jgi:hypothetical protein
MMIWIGPADSIALSPAMVGAELDARYMRAQCIKQSIASPAPVPSDGHGVSFNAAGDWLHGKRSPAWQCAVLALALRQHGEQLYHWLTPQ